MSNDRIKPSWPLWVIMGLILVAGFFCFPLPALFYFSEFGEGAIRFEVPGTSQFVLSKKGSYCLYHENFSVVNGKVRQQKQDKNGFSCVLTDPNGTDVPLKQVESPLVYASVANVGRNVYNGYAIFSFEISTPGTYSLKTSYDKQTVLVVGSGQAKSTAMVLGTCGICFGSVALAILFTVLAIIRITKNRVIAKLSAEVPPPPVPTPQPPK